jgi:hypothetical protein
MDQTSFAGRVHVWFTFISGVIIHRQRVLEEAGDDSMNRYLGTSLVQLGWVFNALRLGSRFIYVDSLCVLATTNNTGGYAVLTAFGANYTRIIADVFGGESDIARLLRDRNLVCFLPGLVWNTRFSSIGNFSAEDPWPAMRRELGGQWKFWLLVVPIGRFPRRFAWLFLQLSRVASKTLRVRNHLSDRLRSARWKSSTHRQAEGAL